MEQFSTALHGEMQERLAIIHAEMKAPLEYSLPAMRVAKEILERLKAFYEGYDFKDEDEEIEFFKNVKPRFASKLIYYNKLYNLEIARPINTDKSLRRYYKERQQGLERYTEKHLEFYRYFRMGVTNLDREYFLRGKDNLHLAVDSFYLLADQRFSSSHDYVVARLLANEELNVYLQRAICRIDGIETEARPALSWTASKVSMVELIYALHQFGAFNNGAADLKTIVDAFELSHSGFPWGSTTKHL